VATENRNIFGALEDYFTRQLDRRFNKDNRFGDVVEDYGNEMLDLSKTFAGNAGEISFSGFRNAAPDMFRPYIQAPAYLSDMAAAGLFGILGAGEKGIAALAEGIAGGTESEDRLTRDILGAAEVAGVNPQGRMAGILAPYAQSYIKARLPDYQYAGRSLLGGGSLDERMEGVREAFTETDMLPKAIGADVPRTFYGKGERSPVASETDTGYYLQDGTFIPFRQAVEKYSPSVRAAEKLPQKKGKYEDLRKWMVDPNKGGANLDELQWTGADEFFAGKTVTKDEIRSYLDERTPIIETTFKEADGTIGASFPSSDEMLEEYLEFALPDEVQYYKDEVIPEMVADGDNVLTADDLNNAMLAWQESNYSDSINLSQQLGTLRRQEGSEAPLYPVRGKDLADMASDMGYDSVTDMHNDYFKGMTYLRFDGNNMKWEKYADGDELAETLGFDAEEMAKDSLMEMAENEGLYSDPAYFYQTILGKSDDYYGSGFNEGDTEYSEYFPAGGRQYSEKVYSLSPESPIYDYTQGTNRGGSSGRGYLPTVDMETASHFSQDADNITAHARTASYDRAGEFTDESVYLFGEGQSDVGQNIRRQKKSISESLANFPEGESFERYAQQVGVSVDELREIQARERETIKNRLRIRSPEQMTALNNYEQASQNLNDDYNLNLQKQYNEFKEQFERSGDIRANAAREILKGAPPEAFDDVLKNASKIDTKVNEEKIEAEFRRLFQARATDIIYNNATKQDKLVAGDFKLAPNKENWTKMQDQLFGLYQAYARDVTNHVDGNPYALKFDDETLIAPSVRSGRMNTNKMYDDTEFFLNKHIMENLEELKPTIAKYKFADDDKFALDRVNEMSGSQTFKDERARDYIKARFKDTFLKRRTFTPFDGKKMTYAEFEDMATNLNMPSMSEYNKNISSSRIKLDVDQAELQRGDEYKKAFPFESSGANAPANSSETVNYVNIPPLTEKTNKWIDMTLKNNLYDAIQSGDEWFALPNAEMVYNKTGGKVRGHEGFYEGIAPKRLEKIIKKIDKNAKLEKLDINTETDPKLRIREPVLGVRLSPEFIKNAAKKGIPQLGVVGGVGLMDFMVRDNKDGRNDSLLTY
tara:strand:- start:666 stop:3971 length:3306 start_codon:yes stop_codon:yes gene_type:complete